MSISFGIDGGSSNSQLFDLLTVVAKPDLYQEKLKSLQAAIDENKALIALVGPASDVLALREKAKDNAAQAADALKQAKEDAQNIVAKAEQNAKEVLSSAQKMADKVRQQAQEALEDAKVLEQQAAAAERQASTAKAQAESAIAAANAKAAELDKVIAETKAAQDDYRATKAGIVAKHRAFIEGL